MKYFRIKYVLSGRYPSKIIAQIIRWENGQLTIKDQQGRLHDLKESNITSITNILSKESSKKSEKVDQPIEQGSLF